VEAYLAVHSPDAAATVPSAGETKATS